MTRRGWLLACSSALCTAGAAVMGAAVAMRWYRPATRDDVAEKQLLDLINAERARYKYKPTPQSQAVRVPPLREHEVLQQVALAQARNMGRNQSKASPPADQLNQELEAAGYPCKFSGTVPDLVYRLDLSDAFATWMEEKTHQKARELLLNPLFADIGIGVYRDGTADAYYLFVLLAKQK